jgi:hypothetical protein
MTIKINNKSKTNIIEIILCKQKIMKKKKKINKK